MTQDTLLKWQLVDTEENQNVMVQHVLQTIRPNYLCQRFECDLLFSYHKLKNAFTVLIGHEIKLEEAFQIVDSEELRNSEDGESEST